MGKGMPSVQAPAPPPTVPKDETLTEEQKRAKANEERRQKLMMGQKETILTTELGASGTPKTQGTGIMGGM